MIDQHFVAGWTLGAAWAFFMVWAWCSLRAHEGTHRCVWGNWSASTSFHSSSHYVLQRRACQECGKVQSQTVDYVRDV